MKRIAIKITGSGGVLSAGEIFCKILFNEGLFFKAEREFPSLIKGGEHNFLIDFSEKEIFSNSLNFDFVCNLNTGEICKNLSVLQKISTKGKFTNMALIGVLCASFDFNLTNAKKIVSNFFKNKFQKENLEALEYGYNQAVKILSFKSNSNFEKLSIINGNEAIAIGALNAGLSHYFAYPMSPATSIVEYLPEKVFKMINADEISAVSMCLGSMYEGKTALTATSSGGFDLMTETISASGVMEIPLVVVLAQRPGPGTGLPTWDSQDNINLAVYGGHGDFPKVVLSISDAKSAMSLMPQAFNLARKFKIPVIVLTQKSIAESFFVCEKNSKKDIYKFLKTAPLVNADEHNKDGSSIDAGKEVILAVEARMSKMKELVSVSPSAIKYGAKKAEISFMCFGSTKGAVVDAIDELAYKGVKANMLCIETLWPLSVVQVREFFNSNEKVVMLEQNFSGQMRRIIENEAKVEFWRSLNKFDGRAFSFEDIIKFYDESI